MLYNVEIPNGHQVSVNNSPVKSYNRPNTHERDIVARTGIDNDQ